MTDYLDVKRELIEAGFDLSSCIVIGSGILNTLKLRPAIDIDIIVDDGYYRLIKESGKFNIGEWPDQEVLQKGIFEIGRDWGGEDFKSAYSKADFIDGVAYFNLKDLRKWKLEKARVKDLKDIELIDRYLDGK